MLHTRQLEKIIVWVTALLFFAPLIVVPSQFIFPFIVPKVLTIRTMVLLLTGMYTILLFTDWKKYKPKITAISMAVLLFTVSFTISTFIGEDWYKSFWDNHERMLGLFTIIHYILLYLVVTSVIKDKKDWQILLRILLGAGSIVMFLGIIQKIQPEFLLNRGSNRVSSTLGNAIYLGGYGMFLSFLSWLVFIKEKSTMWRIYAVVCGISGIIGIFISGTRGAFIGFIAGLGIFFVGYILTLKEHKKIKYGFIALLLIFIGIATTVIIFRETESVRKIPLVGQLVNTSVSSGTAATRIMAWGIAVDAWKEKPVFGWGPNNYYYAFNKYYKPEFLEHGFTETWFDNAHSSFFNTLAVQGVLGIISYMGLFLIPILMIWIVYKKGNIGVHTAVIGTSILIAHGIQQFFVFENPTSYLYFFFWLAYINYTTTENDNSVVDNGVKEKRVSNPIIVSVLLVTILVIYITDINPARANMATLHALRSVNSNIDPLGAFDRALSIPSPHIDDIRNDFARVVATSIPSYVEAGAVDDAVALFQKAYTELDKNIALHPGDIRVHLQKAQLAQVGAGLTKNPQYLVEGEELTKQALDYSKKRQQIYYTLAGFQFQIGRPDQAAESLRTTIEHDPLIAEGWWRLALVLDRSGKKDEAIEVVKEGRKVAKLNDQAIQIFDSILPPEVTDTIDTSQQPSSIGGEQ